MFLDQFGEPDRFIAVIDLLAAPPDDINIFELVAPAMDGGTATVPLFADAMDFTADGRFIIYDALNELRLVSGPPVSAWSIYARDLETDVTFAIVPAIQGLDIGFPALSQTSDNYLTFDVLDQALGSSTIFAANLNTGESQAVGQNAIGRDPE